MVEKRSLVKKKVLIGTVCIIVISTIIFIVYSYLTPIGTLGNVRQEAAYNDKNAARINLHNSVDFQGKFNLPVPHKHQLIKSLIFSNNQLVLEEIKNYVAPTFIDVEITYNENNTIIRYFGDAITSDGETEFYEKTTTFCFALPSGRIEEYGNMSQ